MWYIENIWAHKTPHIPSSLVMWMSVISILRDKRLFYNGTVLQDHHNKIVSVLGKHFAYNSYDRQHYHSWLEFVRVSEITWLLNAKTYRTQSTITIEPLQQWYQSIFISVVHLASLIVTNIGQYLHHWYAAAHLSVATTQQYGSFEATLVLSDIRIKWAWHWDVLTKVGAN